VLRLTLLAPDHQSSQQVLAQGRRRRSSKHHPPAPPKGIKWKRPDARNLGLDRRRVGPALLGDLVAARESAGAE